MFIITITSTIITTIISSRRLNQWDEGRWGKGNKPQKSRIYSREPLAHLALSHLLGP